jgi:hypothetical protein
MRTVNHIYDHKTLNRTHRGTEQKGQEALCFVQIEGKSKIQ